MKRLGLKVWGFVYAHAPEVWALTIAAAVTRLWGLGTPNAVVFDEVYARQYSFGYLTGRFFFDVHPPLSKLLWAGLETLFHLSPYDVNDGVAGAVLLRVLPALAGVAMVPLIYVIVRQLGLGRKVAFLGGLMVLCDNAFLVESRLALKDIMMVLFATAALSAFLKLRIVTGRKRWIWTIVTGVMLGLAVSTKWPALAVIGLLFVAWPLAGLRYKRSLKRMVAEMAVAGWVITAIYVGCFAIHFALLPMTGPGDDFMSRQFQSTLQGSLYYKSPDAMSFADKFAELNIEMYTANRSLIGVHHPYESRWYEWPFEQRDVLYWIGKQQPDGSYGRIYLLGNPIVWWLSAFVTAVSLGALLFNRHWLGKRWLLVVFLLAGFLFNYLPFVPVVRQMFLYNYFLPLVFSILLTCLMAKQLLDWLEHRFNREVMYIVYYSVVTLIILTFIYFLPLSYGWVLSNKDFDAHLWLNSWR